MALVGRQRELREIDRCLDRAARGIGGLVAVVGGPGSGKTALVDEAADMARQQAFEVHRAIPAGDQSGRLLWAQLMRTSGAPADLATRLLANQNPLEFDDAARLLSTGVRRLILIDDIERGGREAVDLLGVVSGRLPAGATVVLVTTSTPLGIGRELRLSPLSEDELGRVVHGVPDDVRHALWVASRGWPGVATSLRTAMEGLPVGQDPLVYLALHAESTAEFLEADVNLVRLLETALERPVTTAERARLLARLAYELLGDASAGARRRALIDGAIDFAQRAGDARTLAEVLDARLHALWAPQGADDRLATAFEILRLARTCGDEYRERRALFWRFVALMELGRVGDAESALAEFEHAARAAADAEGAVLATARHSMLATFRGRYDEARRLADEVAEMGRRACVPDTDRLVRSLHGSITADCGTRDQAQAAITVFFAYARRLPGHLYESTAVLILASLGRESEARMELQRVLPRALLGSGPRWLPAMADLAAAAALVRDTPAAQQLYAALLPYRGRLVVWGGANACAGPVSRYLGLLATQLGLLDQAIVYLEEAIAFEEEVGALPGLAHSLFGLADAFSARGNTGDQQLAAEYRRRAVSLAQQLGMRALLDYLGTSPATDAWTLRRDGDDWLLDAGQEHVRLRASRGLEYLRALLALPGRDVAALDLVAGGKGPATGRSEALLDPTALRAYRTRLAELTAGLEAADQTGEAGRAQNLDTERQSLLAELRRAMGLGGRVREVSRDAERARVNVTRTLRSTIERISERAPLCAAHLRASVRTGQMCRYEAAPGGPAQWRV